MSHDQFSCTNNILEFYFLFAEEGGEVFQVKKSSYSKKVMKMLDKERKKKKYKDSEIPSTHETSNENENDNNDRRASSIKHDSQTLSGSSRYAYSDGSESRHHHSDNHFNNLQENDTNNKFNKRNKSENSNSIQTEIRTADFVVRLL